MALFFSKRFLPLFVTQFLGAFNDNLLKNALVMLITYRLAEQTGDNAQIMVTLAAGLFILPFFLFSATAGQLADKYNRSLLTRWIKLLEIGLAIVAAIGFYLESSIFLLAVLFAFGVHATFFGPIKYALLPQHLQDNELVLGNGFIEAGTFLAILIGTIMGGILVLQPAGNFYVALAMVICACMGYAASKQIPDAPAPDAQLHLHWNVARETWRLIKYSREDRRVFLCILGISWFWLVGATFLSQFPTYVKESLHGNETVVTLFLTVFSLGIGIGSVLCNRLLKGKISSVFVPAAAMGISLFGIDLYFAGMALPDVSDALIGTEAFSSNIAYGRILIDLLFIAICGGIYIVPLYAIMQHYSPPMQRARVIAANNIINAAFMVVAAVLTLLMLSMSFSVPQVFLSVALINMPVGLSMRRLRQRAINNS